MHKKCANSCSIRCGHRPLPRRMTTFGVPLSDLCLDSQTLPTLLTKCVQEIHRRGLTIKGLYRVSGVKSRVEKLCQAFETGGELVELRDVNPNVLAGVLKMFLRQLPEPLLTFRLYSEFIAIAKQWPASRVDSACTIASSQTMDPIAASGRSQRQLIKQLKQAVTKLPEVHLTALAYLIKHLRRVADQQEENHMPPSNLGIVFGPTLLRGSEGQSSLSSLVDTVHQTRLVELLIMYCYELFGGNLMEDADLFDSCDPTDSSRSTGLEKSATAPEVRSNCATIGSSVGSFASGPAAATSTASISSALSSASNTGSTTADSQPLNAQVAGDLQHMIAQLNCEDLYTSEPSAIHFSNFESEEPLDRNNNSNNGTHRVSSLRNISQTAPVLISATVASHRPNLNELRRQFFTQEPIAHKLQVHLASQEFFDDPIDTFDTNQSLLDDSDVVNATNCAVPTTGSSYGSALSDSRSPHMFFSSSSSSCIDSSNLADQSHVDDDLARSDFAKGSSGAIKSIVINTGSAPSPSNASAASSSATSLLSTLRPAALARSGNSINLLHAKEDNREPKFV
jgi:hypothetical protein